MGLDAKQRVMAYVVVKPEGRRPSEPPSTRNLGAWNAPAARMREAEAWFQSKGFATGAPGVNHFSVEGEVQLFERVFDVELETDSRGGIVLKGRHGGTDLPVPAVLAGVVDGVGFPDAPELMI